MKIVPAFNYPFTIADANKAIREWGCNCGPSALAFAAQTSLDAARAAITDFDSKHYTSPTMMRTAVAKMGREFDEADPNDPCRPDLLMCIERRIALVRVQWTGPWTQPGVNPKWAYWHTHWVAAWRDRGVPLVFDINGGVNRFEDWAGIIVPELTAGIRRADGGWHPTHVWRLIPALQDHVPVIGRGHHPNSRAAFHGQDFNGREREVLEALRRLGRPSTDREVMAAMGSADPNVARPRLTTLIHAGVLREVGDTLDAETNKRVRRVWFMGDSEGTPCG